MPKHLLASCLPSSGCWPKAHTQELSPVKNAHRVKQMNTFQRPVTPVAPPLIGRQASLRFNAIKAADSGSSQKLGQISPCLEEARQDMQHAPVSLGALFMETPRQVHESTYSGVARPQLGANRIQALNKITQVLKSQEADIGLIKRAEDVTSQITQHPFFAPVYLVHDINQLTWDIKNLSLADNKPLSEALTQFQAELKGYIL